VTDVKKLLALVAAAALVASPAGLALAQTPTAPPAEKQAAEKKPAEKKMPVKSANGTVKSATADSVVVAGKDRKKDVEWTFAVDTQTAIKKGGKSITAADLKAGDAVYVRYMDAGGKAVAQAITVRSGQMAKKTEPKAADKK
jgi:hypothetical protein